eukprot:2773349-Rhodomonas_salina.1
MCIEAECYHGVCLQLSVGSDTRARCPHLGAGEGHGGRSGESGAHLARVCEQMLARMCLTREAQRSVMQEATLAAIPADSGCTALADVRRGALGDLRGGA